MAKPSSWIAHVDSFVDPSRPSNLQAVELEKIAALVKEDKLDIGALVIGMDQYLTTTDHVVRGRGILLLAEILNHLSEKPLHHQTVKSLVEFFVAKLEDWHSLHGALVGSLALLRRKNFHGAVESSDALALARSFLKNVHVQSLAVIDRKLCLEILLCLLKGYPATVVVLDDELVHGICASIDEEKDPSCLMFAFDLVGSLARLFPHPDGPVSSFSQDLFDILSQYYPIYFTHPNSQNLTVKREDLSDALMHAFVSCPFFEPFVIPLLLEKLSSSFPLAKIDSLKYLDNCLHHYGVERMVKHATTIWSSLKEVIFSSPQVSFLSTSFESARDAQSEENQIAKEALKCLQTAISCLDSCDKKSFLSLILEDDDIRVKFSSIVKERTHAEMSENSQRQLIALGSILCTSSKSSMNCCTKVFHQFFPHLMELLGVSISSSSKICLTDNITSPRVAFGALYLCTELLNSSRELILAFKEASHKVIQDRSSWFCLLQDLCSSLCYVLGAVISDLEREPTNVLYAVRGLEVLATFPGFCSPLSDTSYEDILVMLMSIIICKFEDTFLWNLSLKALVHIGSHAADDHESFFKGPCYKRVVILRITAFLDDDCNMSLALKLKVFSEISRIGQYACIVAEKLAEVIISYLENCLRGDLNIVEILGALLDCLTCQVLPWFSSTDLENVAPPFVLRIWSLVDGMTIMSTSVIIQDLLHKVMTLMKLLVAGMTEGSQHMILEKAYNIVSLNIIPTKLGESECSQNLPDISCKDEWIISLFASVVIALRRQTPLIDDEALLNLFMIFLLRGSVPAAQAFSSMLNKWPVDAHHNASTRILDEVIDNILEKSSWSFNSTDHIKKFASLDKEKSSQTNALRGLAWFGKGLLMRGHEKVKEIVMLLLKCLISSDMDMDEVELAQQDMSEENGEQDQKTHLAKVAADAFRIILSDSEDCLNKKFHAIIRPLYKQRFFSSMLPIILSSIRDSSSLSEKMLLYRAFGHITTETPLAAVVSEPRKIILPILDALATLSSDVENKNLVYSLLLVFSGILMDDDGKEVISEHVNHIVGHLIKLVSYPHMALVRETAIQCLVAMSGLPHSSIYPMRLQVLQAVSVALDDPKRAVRQEAVRCRQAWASTASRSLMF